MLCPTWERLGQQVLPVHRWAGPPAFRRRSRTRAKGGHKAELTYEICIISRTFWNVHYHKTCGKIEHVLCGGLASYLVISRGSKRRFQKAAVWSLPTFSCGLCVMTDFPKGAQIVFLLPMLCYVDKTGGSRPPVYRSTRPLSLTRPPSIPGST